MRPSLNSASIPIKFYDCNSRVHHTQFNGHGYFFSWEHKATKNLTVNWLTGRNICRRHCMDLVSLETDDEIDFLNARIARAGTKFTWTSGKQINVTCYYLAMDEGSHLTSNLFQLQL